MKCPIDTTVDLVMTDRSGIEIDYCPTCRGVWLDRGELDKIIERSAAAVAPMPAPAPASMPVAAMPAPVIVPADDRRWKPDDRDDRDDRSRNDRDRDRDRDKDRDKDRDRDDRYRDDRYRDDRSPRKKKRESFLGELFDF